MSSKTGRVRTEPDTPERDGSSCARKATAAWNIISSWAIEALEPAPGHPADRDGGALTGEVGLPQRLVRPRVHEQHVPARRARDATQPDRVQDQAGGGQATGARQRQDVRDHDPHAVV